MINLTQIDSAYNKSISDTFEKLKVAYNNIDQNYKFDLSNTEITEAILQRLKTYYVTQNNIKTFLDKRYLAAASDFFVESTLFFLKLYFKSKGGHLQAHSERQIKQTKNAIRSDISIWKENEVIAIIECKTQLGWNRHNWEQQYLDRDAKLKVDFPRVLNFGGVQIKNVLSRQENYTHLTIGRNIPYLIFSQSSKHNTSKKILNFT